MKLYAFIMILIVHTGMITAAEGSAPKELVTGINRVPLGINTKKPEPQKTYSYSVDSLAVPLKITITIEGGPTVTGILEGYAITNFSSDKAAEKFGGCKSYIAVYTGSEGDGPRNKKILEQDPNVGTITTNYVIVCPEQQKVYTNIRSREGSLTGTPGYLSDRENYFGTVKIKDSVPGRMGSGSRVDFYSAQ